MRIIVIELTKTATVLVHARNRTSGNDPGESPLYSEITIAEITNANRTIGTEHPPFVLAKMFGNYNRQLGEDSVIVDAAVKIGTDALGLQTYTTDMMTTNLSENELFASDKVEAKRDAALGLLKRVVE